MNRDLPTPIHGLLCPQTRIVEPTLIEEVSRSIRTSRPRKCRNRVYYQTYVLRLPRLLGASASRVHPGIIGPLRIVNGERSSGSNS